MQGTGWTGNGPRGDDAVESVEIEPLNVPLREPFVIATARIETTAAAIVRVKLRRGDWYATGIGEAATLAPVTETYAEVDACLRAFRSTAVGRTVRDVYALGERVFASSPVARAAVGVALMDASSRLYGEPLHVDLRRGARLMLDVDTADSNDARELRTDVTLPIADRARMTHLAREWRAVGFTDFKVKIGKDPDHDVAALLDVHRAVPDAVFRLDANEGFTADQALELLRTIQARGCVVACFEQPCRRDDLEGMAKVTASTDVPVIADESLRSYIDFDEIEKAKAASGVNLKLVKLGGPLDALLIGARAKKRGMKIMCGAMVETRLGLVAMAHVAAALGGIDFVDLDTAFLLADDPFEGGWVTDGPRIRLTDGPGLDVRLRER